VRLALRFGGVIAALAIFGFGASLGLPTPAASVTNRHVVSAPGCLMIVGKPTPPTCLPCPPLWLGGPTIRCVSRLPSAVGSFTRTRD